MKLSARLERDYAAMLPECALVTAADAKYAPFLLNALASIHANFPAHPQVFVFDLGLSRAQRSELATVPWVTLRPIPPFIPGWKEGWSWKPYILTQVERRYVLYFDAANIVLYRSLAPWFLSIKRHGFFGIANGQSMADITPSDYWPLFGLDAQAHASRPTFGAGLFGFDNAGAGAAAVRDTLEMTVAGYNLGRSATERNPLYSKVALRDCPCFRADQTLFNLAFLKHVGGALLVRDELRYCGRGGPADHPRQYLWYARRHKKSLLYFNRPLHKWSAAFVYNRLFAWVKLLLRWRAAEIVRLVKSTTMRYNAG